MKICTARDIAEIYHITEKRVRVIATTRGVGQKVGKWGMWVFRESDVVKLKPGRTGRPRNE